MGNTAARGGDNASNVFGAAVSSMRAESGEYSTTGGCPCGGGYFGGDSDDDPAKSLRDYASSFSAKTKEDTIRRLARALKRAGIDVDPNGDLDSITQNLVTQIPNPKNGKTFSTDAKSQEKVCRVIADVLNDEFSPGVTKPYDKIIDTSLSAVEVCRRVSELTTSFTHGVNAEFLAVNASVKNVLRAVTVLDEIMAEIHKKIMTAVEKDGDASLNRKFDPLNEVYIRAQHERRLQEKLLKDILHVQLAPAAKELEIALRDDSEQHALIKRLGLKPGTSEFADSLASAVSGLGTAASVAHRVHKALKAAGIRVKKYLESPDYEDFEKMLDKKVESGQIKPNDLAKFLYAMDTLRRNFEYRTESQFKQALNDYENDENDKDVDMPSYKSRRDNIKYESAVRGAARDYDEYDEEDVYATPMDKRVRTAKIEKKLIIHDFVTRMSRHYKTLLETIKKLSPALGKTIPITYKTEELKDAIIRLQNLHQERIELDLIGYHSDSDSRGRKELFLSGLRLISGTCSELMGLEMFQSASAHLASLKDAVDSLEKTIDYFSDVMKKKYGGEEMDKKSSTLGGATGGNDLLPEITNSTLSLFEAVSEFQYFYYIANVHANLEQSSTELKVYGEKYVEVLGDAVAIRLWNLRKERTAILDKMSIANITAAWNAVHAGGGGGAVTPLQTALQTAFANAAHGAPLAPAMNAQDKLNHTAALKMVNSQFDIKEKFYKALQAIDLYLKAFTTGIVKDPEATHDIKKMLDGTQVIARWFNNSTGDDLWKSFEYCTRAINAAGNAAANNGHGNLTAQSNAETHYYSKLHTAAAGHLDQPLVGHPQFGIPAGEKRLINGTDVSTGDKIRQHISNTLDNFQALKNLINAFSRIGEHFGGHELRSQVFMSPTQIFKILTDYIKHSALSVNTGKNADAPVVIDNTFVAGVAAVHSVGEFHMYFSGISGNYIGNYEVEDKYFTIIVKSIASKILTTLGTYDMFERNTPIFELTPTRMIIGGAVTLPEVIKEASDLYFRLPRLIEFYRELLHWDGNTGALKIAMLPELEGVFSGIIRIIFQKNSGPTLGDYSDNELYTLISEINRIYNYFHEKDRENTTKAAMNALIIEINQRYGVIKGDEMKKYWDLVKRVKSTKPNPTNETNYSILPGEDENEVIRRAPSDRYGLDPTTSTPSLTSPLGLINRIELDPDINTQDSRRSLLRSFRAQIEGQFSRITPKTFSKTAYATRIKQAKLEIQQAPTKESKVTIAMKLIQSSNALSIDANKALMFHETVITGLNTVGAMYQYLENCNTLVDSLNPANLEMALADVIYGLMLVHNAGVGATTITENNIITALTAPYKKYLVNQGGLTLRNGISERAVVWQNALDFLNIRALYLDVQWAAAADNAAAELILNAGGLGGLGAVSVAINALHVATGGVGGGQPMNPEGIALFRLPLAPSHYIKDTGAFGNLTPEKQSTIKSIRLAVRLLTDYPNMMKDYIELLFNLKNNNLVDVRFPQDSTSQVQVNFVKFQSLTETLLSDIKYYIDVFRPFIDSTIIEKFEDEKHEGSVYWLEKNLVDKYFRGGDDPVEQNLTLDGLSRRINNAFRALTGDTNAPLGATIVNANLTGDYNLQSLMIGAQPAAGPALDAYNATKYETYGNTLASLVWYSSNKMDLRLNNPGPSPVAVALAGAAAEYKKTYNLGDLIQTTRPTTAAPNTAPHAVNVANSRSRFNLYSNTATVNPYGRSLMFTFNQLLAEYLSVCSDPVGSHKIYINLINAFANGVASNAVLQPEKYTFPDLAGAAAVVFGLHGDPNPRNIIFQSLAWIMQRIVKDSSPTTQIPDHLVSTLTDVPLYLKESYRANLPGFIHLFENIIQKCEFIKELMQKTSIDCSRPSVRFAYNIAVAAANMHCTNLAAARLSDDGGGEYNLDVLKNSLNVISNALPAAEMKTRLLSVIDAISTASYTLSSSASEVYKELTDQPIYLQTHERSVETYKLRYGKLPLMPLSLLMFPLENKQTLSLSPRHTMGEPDFKFQYGIRGLLAQYGSVEFNAMPGVKELLDNYNMVSATREQVDTDRYLNFTKNIITSLRYLTDSNNYKSLLSSLNLGYLTDSDYIAEGKSKYYKHYLNANAVAIGDAANVADVQVLIGALSPIYDAEYAAIIAAAAAGVAYPAPAGAAAAPPVPINANLNAYNYATAAINKSKLCALQLTKNTTVYILGKTVQDVVTMVESSNQEDQLKNISGIVSAGVPPLNIRADERVYNLIEMNVMPINVHALMRDIPLANLYNYEYTFEQMVALLYGTNAEKIDVLVDDTTMNTHQMFLRMLSKPYTSIDDRVYGNDSLRYGSSGFIHRIFRGDNDLGLGRPKFLSDQLFNKALFGSIYQDKSFYDEAGPGAGAGSGRGEDKKYLEYIDNKINEIYTMSTEFTTKANAGAAAAPAAANFVSYFDALKYYYYFIRASAAAAVGAIDPVPNYYTNLQPKVAALTATFAEFPIVTPAWAGANAVAAPPNAVLTHSIALAIFRYPGGGAQFAGIANLFATEEVRLAALYAAATAINTPLTDAKAACTYTANNNNSPVRINPAVILNADAVLIIVNAAIGAANAVNAAGYGNLNETELRRDIGGAGGVDNYEKYTKFVLAMLNGLGARFLNIMRLDDAAVAAAIVGFVANLNVHIESFTQKLQTAINTKHVALPAIPLELVASEARLNAGLRAAINAAFPFNALLAARTALTAARAPLVVAANAPPNGIARRNAITAAIEALRVEVIAQILPIIDQPNNALDDGILAEIKTQRARVIALPFDNDNAVYPANDPRSTNITYLDAETERPSENAITNVTFEAGGKRLLQRVGKARFDTKLVRNLFFITNVLRIVRLRLNRELSHSRNVIVSSHMAVSSAVTEYGTDPFTPNEVYDSKLRNGLERYNDRDTF